MSFNDPIDENTDIFSAAFVKPYFDIACRSYYRGNDFREGGIFPVGYKREQPTDGFMPCSATTDGPALTDGEHSVRFLQSYQEAYCVEFRVPSSVHTAFTLTTWRAAAGLNASGFRRKRPREIFASGGTATLSNATDIHGNAAASWQTAYAIRQIASVNDVSGTGLVVGSSTAYLVGDTTTVYRYTNGTPKWTVALPSGEGQSVGWPGVKPTSGTFRLSFKGQQTGPIAYNAMPFDIATELNELPGLCGVSTFSGSAINTATAGFNFVASRAMELLTAQNIDLSHGVAPTVTRTTVGVVGWEPETVGIYRHNGTNWVKQTIADQPAVDSLDSAAGTMPYGLYRAGDYYGHWLFSELRSGFQQLYITGINNHFGNNTQLWDYMSSDGVTKDRKMHTWGELPILRPGSPDWASAKSAAEGVIADLGINQNNTAGSIMRQGTANFDPGKVPAERYFGTINASKEFYSYAGMSQTTYAEPFTAQWYATAYKQNSLFPVQTPITTNGLIIDTRVLLETKEFPGGSFGLTPWFDTVVGSPAATTYQFGDEPPPPSSQAFWGILEMKIIFYWDWLLDY